MFTSLHISCAKIIKNLITFYKKMLLLLVICMEKACNFETQDIENETSFISSRYYFI